MPCRSGRRVIVRPSPAAYHRHQSLSVSSRGIVKYAMHRPRNRTSARPGIAISRVPERSPSAATTRSNSSSRPCSKPTRTRRPSSSRGRRGRRSGRAPGPRCGRRGSARGRRAGSPARRWGRRPRAVIGRHGELRLHRTGAVDEGQAPFPGPGRAHRLLDAGTRGHDPAGTAHVHVLATEPQLGSPLQHGGLHPVAVQPVGQRRTGDARSGDEHSAGGHASLQGDRGRRYPSLCLPRRRAARGRRRSGADRRCALLASDGDRRHVRGDTRPAPVTDERPHRRHRRGGFPRHAVGPAAPRRAGRARRCPPAPVAELVLVDLVAPPPDVPPTAACGP